jgi:very-short-patch-repair endonuclease
MENSHYNKKLKALSRKLRNNSTPGEIKLWTEVLRAKKMRGYQFLRQYAIDNYIADFACRKLKLIIELDGYSHEFKYESDQQRDQRLKELGYSIIRFEEKEIFSDLDNVIRRIEQFIDEVE